MGIPETPELLPDKFALYPNYPNPFNPSTTIRYDLPKEARVRLVIYNLLGQRVRTLVNGRESAGIRSARWDGRNDQGSVVSSGVYIYRLETERFTMSCKFMFLKVIQKQIQFF